MKTVARNTAFGRSYNREFTQVLIDLITSFFTETDGDVEVKLKVTVTKGRYIGGMWVELYQNNTRQARERYSVDNFMAGMPRPIYHMLLWELKFAERNLREMYLKLVEEHKPPTRLVCLKH